MTDYYSKYLKYKGKYLSLKNKNNQIGGGITWRQLLEKWSDKKKYNIKYPSYSFAIKFYPFTGNDLDTMVKYEISREDGLAEEQNYSFFEDKLILRVIGYPGNLRIDHPTNLQVDSGRKQWLLNDKTLLNAELANDGRQAAAEFDLNELINNIDKNIIENKPIKIYGNGNMYRDFTYVDDVVSAILKLINTIPSKSNKNEKKLVPAEIYNIGNNQPVKLMEYIYA